MMNAMELWQRVGRWKREKQNEGASSVTLYCHSSSDGNLVCQSLRFWSDPCLVIYLFMARLEVIRKCPVTTVHYVSYQNC